MKHTPEAMRDIARRIDEVAFNTGAIFPRAVNEAVAMLRDIADEMEATNYTEIPEGWQTIDTAPKDGTTIILACGNRVTVGDWISPEMVNNWDGDDFDAHWQSWDGGFINESEHSATHWMPLPAAPSPKGACEHEWVDASNSRVQGGELCLKCYAIRATLSPKGDV